MRLAHIADRVARDLYTRPIDPWRPGASVMRHACYDALRDACDLATGSDLSTSLLDRLADMVEARLRHPERYKALRPLWLGQEPLKPR